MCHAKKGAVFSKFNLLEHRFFYRGSVFFKMSCKAAELMLPFTRAIRNTIECTLREHSIVMNRVFAPLPASAEHPAQHSRAAADHQCSKKVITDILKTVIDYQSQSCQHTKIQTSCQKSP